MNIDIKTLRIKLKRLLGKFLKYKVFITVIAILCVYGWLVFRINTLNSQEPSDDAITERLQTSARPKIDQAAVDKIQQLEDNSSDVQTLFKQARDNPFQE